MKVALIVTMLACLLALGGCLTVPETLADSDASVDEDPGTQIWEGVGGAAGGGIATGGTGGEVFATAGTGGGGIAGAGGEAFATGGVGGEAFGAGGAAGGIAGTGGEGFGFPTGGVGGEAFGTGGAGAGAPPDAGFGATGLQLGTRSSGCEPLENSDLCMGEGWMLAEGESIPDCGESGAYRICTFETDACVSHTIMMVQRCD